MDEFEFCIIASGVDHTADDFEERFFDAGCHDALVSFQGGEILLDFTHEAETMEAAILSAERDVVSAGAKVVSVRHPALGAAL